ncbi:magnesium transporter [Singulisphaera sp. GP187]|uniref:magnesium/cobalt transporter CorA n=1 Tax=Singulisphaera sp. GP187 TaxID=1882752 RepID=UPI000928A816|nr:magnesium/cobalt transporter CorA [Singulisphaera sp. GP187]SIO03201.1 magnesium transporter [Singulisphaera sp. GP187]
MSALQADTVSTGQSVTGLQIKVVYRDGDGQIHFDWPIDQIPQALDDAKGTLWVEIEDQTQNTDRRVEELLDGVFHFHPLAIEDAVKDTHVAKVDDWGEYLYIVFHTIDFDPDTDSVRLHELDLFLGRNYLVTYHNEPLKILDQLRRNIERDPANRLKHGAGHLLYHVLDMSVAEYLPAIEHLDEAIDSAQDEVFDRPTPTTLQAIFQVKRSALRLHRILAPEREVLNRLARDEYDPVNPEHRVYFRDVYDHVVRIHDITESLRDLISGALDTYLSAISNRTNDIMKAFTLVTVMFLPLSFLTSFFGMNFFGGTLEFDSWMPKRTLFVGSCLIMLFMPGFLYLFAKRRGWF